jgi:DNA-binding GntR family transcriptional regulator
VKERLLDGRFPGGTLLSENALARELGISRTPLRQAFGQLEAEGLVELYPRRGALVVPISASEADDVHEARELIECHCARRAAEAGADLTGQLEEAIEAQERALSSAGAGFARADRAFHRAIVAAAGNALLARSYVERDARAAALGERLDRLRDALGAGEAEKAAELLREHLSGARALARRRA